MEPFEILDARFRRYALPIVFLEKLHGGMRWPKGRFISAIGVA